MTSSQVVRIVRWRRSIVARWTSPRSWSRRSSPTMTGSKRVRAGLTALLGELDRDRVRARFVFVVALGAGPGVIERRAAVLEVLARVIDEGRRGEGRAARAGELPALTAEGVVGSVVGVIYARLLREDPEPLSELVGPLMASIVLPYLGREAAARELARPVAVARERGEVCDARC